MHRRPSFFVSIISVSILGVLSFSSAALAHVVVKPNEVPAASFQTFTVSVPNEKDNPTTAIKLIIPNNVSHVTPTQKSNWTITTTPNHKDSDTVTAITWSGGRVNVGMRDDFSFSAQVPAEPTELHWKAYQTYADGTIVSWDKASSNSKHESGDSGPFSVTKITGSDTQDSAEQAVDDARTSADRALYIAIGAIIVSMFAVFYATRKK